MDVFRSKVDLSGCWKRVGFFKGVKLVGGGSFINRLVMSFFFFNKKWIVIFFILFKTSTIFGVLRGYYFLLKT